MKAVVVSTGTPMAGSFTLSKNRSMLNPPIRYCVAAASAAGIADMLPVTTGPDPGSGSMV